MSVALEHPMIGPYTVEDWLALDPPVDGSRLELMFGYLHLTPAPSGEHQDAAFLMGVLLRDALRAANRTDLNVALAVNVRISTAWRTALIPDVVILDRKPVGVSFPPEALILAVEVWSPGNPRAERETKMAGYAGAGVPFLWTIEQDDLRGLRLTAYRLENGRYVVENLIEDKGPAVVTAVPIPITVDLAELQT
ncbi:Uma2 family endonuclease [Kibdelosporangium philippinense]|uniref:Uma2 family endonuclease n=1 Tax=Kibdelosporangium philippinense TaxID=211113 RepID=A0ABS8ZLP2_9PSEU|nr:Uma2 family endonuclease [Kibdelosporangium philippinense]MCE7008684.1 Uma2 family endonuclease [Kibdelosporangium philippinense]